MASATSVVPFFIHVPAIPAKEKLRRYEVSCDSLDREVIDSLMRRLSRSQNWQVFPGSDGHFVSDHIIGLAFAKFGGAYNGVLTQMNPERRAMSLGMLIGT